MYANQVWNVNDVCEINLDLIKNVAVLQSPLTN